jgi:two-component system alkaline phosphatase synthesis response regulator PhoP
MKILIIDDDPDMRALAAVFIRHGAAMTVLEADSGSAGVVIAEQERPDAILLDSVMPGMDGEATLGALRANSATDGIPVIFLTATSSPVELERLAQLGVRGVLSKPFNRVSLVAEVRKLLDQG